MNPLLRVDGALRLEGVPLEAIAERFGTPCYAYSREIGRASCRERV